MPVEIMERAGTDGRRIYFRGTTVEPPPFDPRSSTIYGMFTVLCNALKRISDLELEVATLKMAARGMEQSEKE